MGNWLSELYWELQREESPVGLEEFVGCAARGEHGAATPEDLRVCLRAVEAQVVHQIEQSGPGTHDGSTGEDLVEETQAWIEDLVTKFCPG